MSSRIHLLLRAAVVGALLATPFSGVALAAEGAPSQGQAAASSDDNAAPAAGAPNARERMHALRQRLEAIRNQALESDATLQRQQQALQQQVNEQMAARGVDLEEELERLREIATRLRSDELTEAQQQELANEYRSKRRALLEARDAVLNEAGIRRDRERFSHALLAAMKKVEPDVKRIIERYKEARADVRRGLEAGPRGGDD